MPDLVDKFFSSDLSPLEEDELDGLLESSTDAADRFAQKAAEAYARYGLPEEGLPPAGTGSYGGRNLLRFLAALAVVAVIGFGVKWAAKLRPLVASSNVEEGVTIVPLVVTSETLPAQNKQNPDSASNLKSVPALSAPGDRGNKVPETPASGAAAGKTQLQMAGVSSPAPGRGHSRLKIDLVIAQSGPVTVLILDSSGTQVKALYAGNLPAGIHAFIWDGKLDGGKTAPPGQYQIESRNGTASQTKAFWITPKKKTAS